MNTHLNEKVHYTLRLAVAMCFIGHGSFGIITKAAWCKYFAVFGIGEHLSYQLMPVVGFVDIILGVAMLVYPVRAIPAWLVVWGIVTAMLRPLSGEPFAEFIERAGNFGAPLAFLVLSGIPKDFKGWFKVIDPSAKVDVSITNQVTVCLKIIVFFIFIGHGWLNIIEKKGLLNQYTSIGFYNPQQVAYLVGTIEIIAAFVILVKPLRPVIFAFFIWKMGSELLYPHYGLLEWIERGGSYGALLALFFITEKHPVLKFPFLNKYLIQKNLAVSD